MCFFCFFRFLSCALFLSLLLYCGSHLLCLQIKRVDSRTLSADLEASLEASGSGMGGKPGELSRTPSLAEVALSSLAAMVQDCRLVAGPHTHFCRPPCSSLWCPHRFLWLPYKSLRPSHSVLCGPFVAPFVSLWSLSVAFVSMCSSPCVCRTLLPLSLLNDVRCSSPVIVE